MRGIIISIISIVLFVIGLPGLLGDMEVWRYDWMKDAQWWNWLFMGAGLALFAYSVTAWWRPKPFFEASYTPSQPPETTDSQPPETIDEALFPRIFIDKNHLELMNLYRDKTKLQTDLSTSPYEGKWMKPYTYILSDVSTQPLGGVQVFVNMLNCYDKIGCIWLEFDSSYKEYFEPRDPGYSFKAIGKIEKVSTYDITLVECELI